ncbi:MAG: hypothetical protein EOO74_03880, partial [Myxococcales bacterium]
DQMARGFTDPTRGLMRTVATEANNRIDRVAGGLFSDAGYVTTYQAVSEHPRTHQRRMKGHRTLVILDEPHHLADEEGAGWTTAVAPLVEAATCVLLMSGTLRRHDGRRVPFVTYDEHQKAAVDITYTYENALNEKAIRSTNFYRLDALADFERRGERQQRDLSAMGSEDEERDALRTVLTSTSYRDHVLERAFEEFMAYRRDTYHCALCIVVAHSQTAARELATRIRMRFGVHVALAISDEGTEAQRDIRKFQRGECEVLVTVGMAYEGLDVPAATHLICLTNIRSEPWLMQCFARVSRVDRNCKLPWEQQVATVYVPDDARIRPIIDEMRTAKPATYEVTGDEQAEARGQGTPRFASSFVAIGAEVTAERLSTQDGHLDVEHERALKLAREKFPALVGLPISTALPMALAMLPSLVKTTPPETMPATVAMQGGA